MMPPVLTTAMDGSVVSDVTVTGSSYGTTMVFSVSEFTGTIDVRGIAPYSSVLSMPGQDGILFYGTTKLNVVNPSSFTNIFGITYEVEFNSNTDVYGYTQGEVDAEQSYSVSWLGGAALFLLVFGIVTNENVFVLVAKLEVADHKNSLSE